MDLMQINLVRERSPVLQMPIEISFITAYQQVQKQVVI